MSKPALAVAAAVAAGAAWHRHVPTFVPAVPAAGSTAGGGSALRGPTDVNGADVAAAVVGAWPALAVFGPAMLAASKRRAARLRHVRRADAAAAEVPPPTPLTFDPALQLGATAPLGFFDPLGFCKVGDEHTFRSMRAAELKHGRVAMMASVGAVAQALFHFPGFEKAPTGLGAVASEPGAYGLAALVLASGALELTAWRDDPAKGVDSIGDYGNPFQLGMGEPLGESKDMKNREINNGRAAMIAVLGIVAAELATGKNALEQLA